MDCNRSDTNRPREQNLSCSCRNKVGIGGVGNLSRALRVVVVPNLLIEFNQFACVVSINEANIGPNAAGKINGEFPVHGLRIRSDRVA